MKARTGGEKGRHLWPRLVQKVAEGKTSYELSWKVKLMIKKHTHKCYFWNATEYQPLYLWNATQNQPLFHNIKNTVDLSLGTLSAGHFGNCRQACVRSWRMVGDISLFFFFRYESFSIFFNRGRPGVKTYLVQRFRKGLSLFFWGVTIRNYYRCIRS